MAEASEAMKAMARRVADRIVPNPENESVVYKSFHQTAERAALAAIIETTDMAAKYAENIGACSNTSGRGGCCEALGEDIATDLRDGDHISAHADGPIEMEGAPSAPHAATDPEIAPQTSEAENGDASHDDGDRDFKRRVDYAARVISENRQTSRAFDGCFENYDGDAVVAALIRRGWHNLRLDENLPRYICQSSIDEAQLIPADRDLTLWARQLRSRSVEPPPPSDAHDKKLAKLSELRAFMAARAGQAA